MIKKQNIRPLRYSLRSKQLAEYADVNMFADVCHALSGHVRTFDCLPALVRDGLEDMGNGRSEADYQICTYDTHPEIIKQGEFLLLPFGEPLAPQKIKQQKQIRKSVKYGNLIYGNAFPPLPFRMHKDVPFPPSPHPIFKFIDLFAGIGGFRLAMQSVNGECVFSSEWDRDAQVTYSQNFGELPWGDVRAIPEDQIPDHDVLCAGFPCQPFSLAGISARTSINQPSGFQCQMQGTLFFDIIRIVRKKKPQVLFLENVKNLINHDQGKTFAVIKNAIEAEGYSFNYKVIDASVMVPQKRLRCYMVCVRNHGAFSFPDISGSERPLREVLEKRVPEKYTLSDKMWKGHQKRTQRNLSRGTGFTAFCADLGKPAHTLVARYYKDGKECLIPQKGKNPRMLTPRECARLQGFPDGFLLPKSKSAAYRQMGNSVAVPVITEIAREIVKII